MKTKQKNPSFQGRVPVDTQQSCSEQRLSFTRLVYQKHFTYQAEISLVSL